MNAPISKLVSLKVAGFKSIREMPEPLELRNLNVLIGANGAGKSNFFAFFQMLKFAMTESLQLFISRQGFAHSVLYAGPPRALQISAELQFKSDQGMNWYEFRLMHAANDTLIYADESIEFLPQSRGTAHRESLGAGHGESLLAATDGGKGRTRFFKMAIDHWKHYHFHDTSDQSFVRSKCQVKDNRYLRSNAGNLAAFLFGMRETHAASYDRIRDTIRMVAPFFDDFVLVPDRDNPDYICLDWSQRGSDEYFGPGQLSDGTLRFACLATLLLQSQLPDLIVIDEPELGLHPAAVAVLAGLLHSASSKIQIVVSTQSVTLVDQFDPEDVIVVDRLDNQSVFRRLDTESLKDWLDEYSVGDLWLKNVLGGRP